jgi:hypothetical protein
MAHPAYQVGEAIDKYVHLTEQMLPFAIRSQPFVGTVYALAHVTSDVLKLGTGVSGAIYDPTLSPLGRGFSVLGDVGRLATVAGAAAPVLGSIRIAVATILDASDGSATALADAASEGPTFINSARVVSQLPSLSRDRCTTIGNSDSNSRFLPGCTTFTG